MNSLTKQQQTTINQVYDYAAGLMFEQDKNADEVRKILFNKGVDQESATIIIEHIEDEMKRSKRDSANKNMFYGALWCISGTVAILFNFGLIFWAAILIGIIQIFKGLYTSLN